LWKRYRAGIPWRDLPERFGDPIKIHTRFSRWSKSGVWQKLFELLAADADNEYAMIDSTINPLAFFLTAGQAHDLEGADALLQQMEADTPLADKASMPTSA
jgi:transposase